MSTSIDYDVTIIGYGPVGATAANLLGAHGLKVLVVERDADVYARARAISLDEEVLRAWQRIGLAEELKADMIGGQEITFVDEKGAEFWRFTPESRGHGHPPQMFIYQPAVDHTLRAGAERHSTVEVRLGVECIDHSQGAPTDGSWVTLTLNDITSGESSTVRTSWVIAADGGSSPTRGRLSVPFTGRTYEERWIVIDTRVLEPWDGLDRLKFHSDPHRPAVDCPTPLAHHRWEFPVLPADDEAALTSPEGVRTLLEGQGVELHRIEILRSVVYSHHVRFAARWRDGRIFLAGDAAHVMPPWIGQGMSSGVRDVVNLCWKITAVVQQTLPASVLDSYQQERQPHVRQLTRRAVRVGRLITERHPVLRRLRGPVLRALGAHPEVARRFSASSWVPQARIRSGFIAATAPKRLSPARLRRSAVGWQVPQPVVRSWRGSVRLDDLLDQQWAVLVFPAFPGRGRSAAHLRAWEEVGVPVLRVLPRGCTARPGVIVDSEGVLLPWAHRLRATALVLRPDGFVFDATRGRHVISAPPLDSRPVRTSPTMT